MSDPKTVQTLELSGQRYVVLPEAEYLTLRSRIGKATEESAQDVPPVFSKVTPVQVGGVPASEMMLRDRQ